MARFIADIPEEFRTKANYALSHLFSQLDISDPSFCLTYSSNIQQSPSLATFHQEEYELLESGETPKVTWKNGIPFIFLQCPDHKDVVFSTFVLLSGYQEHICEKEDIHGRFPLVESLQYRENILKRPIIQEYAELLKNNIASITKKKVKFKHKQRESIILTHDIDKIHEWKNNRDALGRIWDIISGRIKYRSGALWQVIAYLFTRKDPYDTLKKVVRWEKRVGKNSIFFFMAGFDHEVDGDYEQDHHSIEKTMKWLADRGFQIGLHASYSSKNSAKILKIEKQNIEKLFGRTVDTIRHHYLRIDHHTASCQVEASFKYDHTWGFPESPGFRNGTCWPFNPWNWKGEEALNITAIPLMIMDRTFIGYQNKTPEEALKTIVLLVKVVKKYNGQCSILWHNDVLNNVKYPGWDVLYKKILTLAQES